MDGGGLLQSKTRIQMTEYVLKQVTREERPPRVAVVKAGKLKDAIWTAEYKFGGDWEKHTPHSTLDELKHSVEDAERQAVIVDF